MKTDSSFARPLPPHQISRNVFAETHERDVEADAERPLKAALGRRHLMMSIWVHRRAYRIGPPLSNRYTMSEIKPTLVSE